MGRTFQMLFAFRQSVPTDIFQPPIQENNFDVAFRSL